MSAVPQAVRAAARPVELSLRDPKASSVRRGDLRLVHPLDHEIGGSRVVLILDVDRAHDVVDVALVHAEPDLATDSDVVVPKDVAEAPFPIVVQSDLRSALWTSQVGALVGRLGPIDLDRLNDALYLDHQGELSSFALGLPLDGRADGRWEFKRLEGDDLRRLSADCSAALLDDDADWELDARAVVPGQSDEVLIELMHWLQTRPLRLSETSHEFAQEVYTNLTRESWGEHAELANSLIEAFAEVVMAQPIPSAEGRRRAVLTTLAFRDEAVEFDVVHYLGLELETV